MKALTVHEPFASLIIAGIKTVETRSWPPPKRSCGLRIAIHSAAAEPKLPRGHPATRAAMTHGLTHTYARGHVLGTVILGAPWRITRILGHEMVEGVSLLKEQLVRYRYPTDPYGDFPVGGWVWPLRHPQRFAEPVPATGQQKLWNWTPPKGTLL